MFQHILVQYRLMKLNSFTLAYMQQDTIHGEPGLHTFDKSYYVFEVKAILQCTVQQFRELFVVLY